MIKKCLNKDILYMTALEADAMNDAVFSQTLISKTN